MMILIIGKQDSGKTTRLLDHYATHQQGDGYALLKMMEEYKVLGFHAMRLSTGETHPLLVHQQATGVPYEGMMIGPYIVDEDMYRLMIDAYHHMIIERISPIYIDEIGRWELNYKGFDEIIRKALIEKIDLICTVRDSFLDEVIKHYHLEGNYITL